MTATAPSRRHATWVTTVAVVAAAALTTAGCAGSDSPSAATVGSSARDATTTTKSPYGSHAGMAPKTATVADVAKLGSGPSVGEAFHGFVGLDVCGRFLELPVARTVDPAPTTDGISLSPDGRFTVSPTDEAAAGHAATVGGLARLMGVELSGATVELTPDFEPARTEVAGASIELAGATFGPDARCGDTKAQVELWVYPADAVRTGDGLVKVVDDIGSVPIVQDGMAFVIAVAPESSLPTLPPSAMTR